jgi:hypothetical protein
MLAIPTTVLYHRYFTSACIHRMAPSYAAVKAPVGHAGQGILYTRRQHAHIGMSACCSLDELSKPSFVEHRSRLLPPSQIAQAPSGVRQPPGSQQCRHAPARPDTAGSCSPHAAPAAAGACRRTAHPGGPERCTPGRRARLPRQGACTGGSRLWFPSLRLVFQKGNLTAEILVGAGGFEPPASRL